jgi:hydrogenase maturation protein HypF
MRLELRGSVQGMGFRPWVARLAGQLGLRGVVVNTAGGVAIDAFGPEATLAALRARLEAPPLAGAGVESIDVSVLDDRYAASGLAASGFEIGASRLRGEDAGRDREVSVAPDLPTCAECLAELRDPLSRRYRYPFIACAHCGPRYTIVRDLPWDRQRTAMQDFPLCAACTEEYRDPRNRRFHAEATACPACGPALGCSLRQGSVALRGEAALEHAIGVLRSGGCVAVHGIGGFHLACDASSDAAVQRLRSRKRRPSKPLAVMVRTLVEAEKHALVDAAARALLLSEARPIVLLRRRDDSDLAPSLAPGSPMLGVMLAYTPLHALLLQDFGAPLVMTSANRSGEPIAYRADTVQLELAGLVDAVLVHDREIVAPCDDSVAVCAPSGAIWLRRSRGRVPRPLRLGRPLRHSVLACGGQWSNTVCVAREHRAWPSAHVGDIESPGSVARLEQTVERWLDWLGVVPEVVAHDLHPGYESTRFARASAWPGAQVIGVQHHHAHMAAVLGEHDVAGPALGLVWDGTGAGLDGSAWGGELLLGDVRSVRRLATLRPVALAGGEQAIREPWRLALALLDDAFDGASPLAELALFDAIPEAHLARVAALLARDGLCVPAHGVGRYFDAVAALLLCRPLATYQGELAQALCFAAAGRPEPAYPFELDRTTTPWQLDLRPAVRALVGDLLSGGAPSQLADRFHQTLVAAGTAAVDEARLLPEAAAAQDRVVLAGGCFQNPILVSGLERRLGEACSVLRAVQLPPGDGGLAFGQALVADAVAASDTLAATHGED